MMEVEELKQFTQRSAPDEDGMVNIIEYKVKFGSDNEEKNKVFIREARRVKLIVRDAATESKIQERQRWKYHRFGAAAGAIGPERGITTLSAEEFVILDPLSEEANMTGEDKLLEKIKQKVISQGGRERASELMPERYGQTPNTGGRRSNTRTSMNKSPFRGFEPGMNSPNRTYNTNMNNRNYGHGHGHGGGGYEQERSSPSQNYGGSSGNRRHGQGQGRHSHNRGHVPSGRKSHGKNNNNTSSNRGRKSPGPGRGGYTGRG